MRLALLLLGLMALVTAGCRSAVPAATPTATATATLAASPSSGQSGYAIDIYVNGVKSGVVTMEQIRSLPQVQLEGKPSEMGPTLLSMLAAAGVERFSEAKVIGLSRGRLGSAELTLTRRQINNGLILDLTGAGTVKLSSLDIPQDSWVLDVSSIRVEQGKGEEPAQGYVLEVYFQGILKASFTVEQLKAMPQSQIPVQGTQAGPTLAEVLRRAGIGDFKRVRVTGVTPGRTGPAQRALEIADVTGQILLDMTERGTAKLTGAAFPREQWVIDVTRIDVE
ncbi:MAG: hypothetical protein HY681_05770 [Chloroflexi bacterium]|nr:hypothetical protein [Chloroflexota bacterium]